MACAFGMEACKHYYTVKYVRMPDLLIDLKSAKDDGRFSDMLKKYTNPTLLILDEWLLLKLSEDDAPNLLGLIHKRRKHSSTFFAPSSGRMDGTTSLAARTVLCLLLSWIGSRMTHIRSQSRALIRTRTSLCVRSMVWIQNLLSNC